LNSLLGIPFGYLIVVGFLLKATGYLVRDEMLLRILVVAGMSADVIFLVTRPDPAAHTLTTTGLLIAINVVLLSLIVFERTTLKMSGRERELFRAFPTLQPGHFRKVLRAADWRRTVHDEAIVFQDAHLTELFYIPAERYVIHKNGQRYDARGPAFVGEIAFLTGRQSSATVELPAGTDFVAFSFDYLHAAMKRSTGFSNAMIALFSQDLALKVANSAPIPQNEPGNGALLQSRPPRERQEPAQG